MEPMADDDWPMRIMNLLQHVFIIIGLFAVIVVWGVLTALAVIPELVFLVGNWFFPDPEAKRPPSPA